MNKKILICLALLPASYLSATPVGFKIVNKTDEQHRINKIDNPTCLPPLAPRPYYIEGNATLPLVIESGKTSPMLFAESSGACDIARLKASFGTTIYDAKNQPAAFIRCEFVPPQDKVFFPSTKGWTCDAKPADKDIGMLPSIGSEHSSTTSSSGYTISQSVIPNGTEGCPEVKAGDESFKCFKITIEKKK